MFFAFFLPSPLARIRIRIAGSDPPDPTGQECNELQKYAAGDQLPCEIYQAARGLFGKVQVANVRADGSKLRLVHYLQVA